MSEPTTIRIENMAFAREGRSIFASFSLDLREQRIGLIGNNGSGKSTLLRLIHGLLLPDEGSVTTHGLETRAERKTLPKLSGFLFQNPDRQIIFPTVGEELAFTLLQRGVSPAEAETRVLGVLRQYGREDWLKTPVATLSDGQKQLICLLALLIGEPKLLLLDEPFSSLDIPTRLILQEMIAKLPQQVIMTSHHLSLLSGFERIIWLDKGRLRADGSPDEVLPAYRAFAIERASNAGIKAL